MSTKTLLTLVAPGALVLVAGGTFLLLPATTDLAGQAARGYPVVALISAALLAWRLHRSRLFMAALVLLLAHTLLHPGVLGTSAVAAAATGLLLPLLLAALALTADRSLGTRQALVQLLIVAVPAATAAVAIAAAPDEVARLLLATPLDPIYTDWTGLQQVACAAALLGGLTMAILALRRARAADAGLAWSALAGMLAIGAAPGSAARGLWLLAAGVILIVALVESSYVMAFHDELTGLPGRRALTQCLNSLRAPYAVAIVDIDHFKSFNDRYGHDVGDDVLRMVAGRLAAVQGGGRAFRSGGEEFTLVFPGRTKAEAVEHVEAVRAAVADARFTLRTKPRPSKKEGERRRGRAAASQRQLSVTISVGLAGVGGRNLTTDAVIKAADKAMYRAKKGGRNRVVA